MLESPGNPVRFISDETLVDYCNSRCVIYIYHLNGFNLLRGEFDDFDRTKDWLQPFVQSMLIFFEHRARGQLGLESLISDVDGIVHSGFYNKVVEGHRNPYYEWDKMREEIERDALGEVE